MFDYDNYPTRNIYDGTQSVIRFGKLELSVVRHSGSYGGKQGLYEIGVFKGNEMVSLPGITEEHDTVKGFLSEDNVVGIIKKMSTISGVFPAN